MRMWCVATKRRTCGPSVVVLPVGIATAFDQVIDNMDAFGPALLCSRQQVNSRIAIVGDGVQLCPVAFELLDNAQLGMWFG